MVQRLNQYLQFPEYGIEPILEMHVDAFLPLGYKLIRLRFGEYTN